MTREGTKVFCCTDSGVATRRGAPMQTVAYEPAEAIEVFGDKVQDLLLGARVWITDSHGYRAEWVCASVLAEQALGIRGATR